MLGAEATDFLRKLCDFVPDDGYKVKEWSELRALCADADELWKQLVLNGCVGVKFSDADEVCFCVTGKARVLKDECEALEKQCADDRAVVKTDATGRAVMVVPKNSAAEKKLLRAGGRMKTFLIGLLGGVVGGVIVAAAEIVARLLGA